MSTIQPENTKGNKGIEKSSVSTHSMVGIFRTIPCQQLPLSLSLTQTHTRTQKGEEMCEVARVKKKKVNIE